MPPERHPVRLADYMPPAFLIETVELIFELDREETRVTTRIAFRRNSAATECRELVLYGRELTLERLVLDGQELPAERYRTTPEELVIREAPAQGVLEVVTLIRPAANTALEGLYLSAGILCTQCEAEGFRRITYFPDRPDLLARYSVTLTAARAQFPVLLANGNCVARGELPDGRHFATWIDPYPKPSYLFALVAGDLVREEDRFTTSSGREVALHFFVEARNAGRCGHAIAALKRAMRWDEERYGREYDLDVYMVVAVDDFNMGAMENKGLNLFNARYVLARPEIATDSDYQAIESVIAHEYFHNWTGNRVTCRDWFQLALKEGLTVYRDQCFSAEVTAPAVKRIEDVRMLRSAQFPEDAGPLAHPVRPTAYEEISNFYTATVYNKGAEVVRMLANLLGEERFRRGMDLYFARHDGQAVTVEDFLQAHADASGMDLTPFRRWYSQAGTPQLEITGDHDATNRSYRLEVRQTCPPTPGQEHKEPLVIPLAMGLLGADGRELPLQLEGEEQSGETTRVLVIREREQSFLFTQVAEAPVPSLLRGFSAPVRLAITRRDDELALLLAHDRDPFARWDAGQQLMSRALLARVAGESERAEELARLLHTACGQLLGDEQTLPALRALALTLPAETWLAEQMEVVDPDGIRCAREAMRERLGAGLESAWRDAYARHRLDGPYRPAPDDIGRRSLRNLALAYLVAGGTGESLAAEHYARADNMTDRQGALAALAATRGSVREAVFADFEREWRAEPLVLDKWFALQASAPRPGVLAEVVALMGHPVFTLRNPNRVRALLGSFAHGNPAAFHASDGSGYRFIAERVVELDRLNPQVAARLAAAFTRWRRYDPARQDLMRAELEGILRQPGLSRDVAEIAGKSLA